MLPLLRPLPTPLFPGSALICNTTYQNSMGVRVVLTIQCIDTVSGTFGMACGPTTAWDFIALEYAWSGAITFSCQIVLPPLWYYVQTNSNARAATLLAIVPVSNF
jgi:hypothetical protein